MQSPRPGLVIVSHSRQLAEAACRLAKSVARGDLPVDFAGGAGDDHGELGTDATDIMDAIRRVDSGAGVLVLVDLGSAVLSAKLAEQMLEDEVNDIMLCPGPLVEGAVAAAVQIAAGSTMKMACAEAKKALEGKRREITEDLPAHDTRIATLDAPVPSDATRFRFTMDDPNGMHTRPAAEFVKTVSGFTCEVRIRNLLDDGPFVNARSLNQIALSNISRGDIAEVAVWGPDADAAVLAIKRLVADVYRGREVEGVPDIPDASFPGASPAPPRSTLTALSPGVAMGTLALFGLSSERLTPTRVNDTRTETLHFEQALLSVRSVLEEQLSGLEASRETEAAILEAQLLILDDAEILDAVRSDIRSSSLDAASCYQRRMSALADSYRALSSPYLRERAADVDGVAELVIDTLAGRPQPDLSAMSDVIIWAPEVSPALLGRFKRGQLAGILTREGGPTAHVAILARAMSIPAMTGFSPPAGTQTGAKIAMDANRLEVLVDPSSGQTVEFETHRQKWAKELEQDRIDSQGSAKTLDGESVAILANVGDAVTTETAVLNHAEGVGLFRTEFLYLDRRLPPDEEEQTRQLARILEPFAALPCIVRTLDAGGDKPMPWLNLPPESNPYLGVRGVRLAMAHPDLFKTQLRAILRAGGEMGARQLGVMVPMVGTMEEVTYSREMLGMAHRELEESGTPHAWPVRFGIMVETPAAALLAERLAASVDFFSLGTNDLTQYVMCAERGSKTLARLSDPMHPAVLSAIALVVKGAAKHGAEVGVCGEMAGDPVAAAALIGLGVRHLSMNPSAIGRVKRMIRLADTRKLAKAVKKALGRETSGEARADIGKGTV